MVTLRGSAPTERFFQKINVGADDERALRLNVPTRRLTGQLTMGGKPLGGVTVTLQHDTWNWISRLTAGADGRISAPLWTEGDYLVDLREGDLTAPVKLMATLVARRRSSTSRCRTAGSAGWWWTSRGARSRTSP